VQARFAESVLSITDPIPKVELHCHVEGTLRPTTAAELGTRYGLPIPERMTTRSGRRGALSDYESLNDFLDDYWKGQALLQTPDDWRRLGYESMVDGAAHGLRYRESFFTPTRHLDAGQSLGSIVAGLSQGLMDAESDTGAVGVLICDMDRAYGGAAGRRLIEELVALRPATVIGVGMDSTELGVDLREYADALRIAKRNGFRVVTHAGEDTGPENIRIALSMGVERIDHGLSVSDDPELVREVSDRVIPFTVCPSSNELIAKKTTIQAHPLRRMFDEGVLVSVNTDDPGFTGVDLGMEYALLLENGWTLDGVQQLAKDAVTSSFLEPAAKFELHREIEQHFAGLGAS
jgi:adenosine deaminase